MADPTTPTSTSTSTSYIDPNMLPYYQGLAATTQGLAKEPYTLYQGNRVAGFDPMQQQAFSGIAGMTQPNEYNTASGLYGQAAGYQAGTYTPPPTLGGATFSTIGGTSPTLGGANFTGADQLAFNQNIAQQYMNPYQMSVLDVAARKMREEGARNIALGGLKAAGLGGYGGSGNAINAAAVNRALTTGMGDLYSTGLAQAYANAQQQYNADRTARLLQEQTIEKARQDIYNANVQAQQNQLKLRLDQEAEAEKARQAVYGINTATGLDAFKVNQAAQQAQAENQKQVAQGLMSLAGQRQTSDLSRLAALEQAGRSQQALRQRQLDIDYENFIAQRDWQRNLISWASNIIHGLPAGQAEVRYNYDAPPSTVNQLAGLAGAFLSGTKLAGT